MVKWSLSIYKIIELQSIPSCNEVKRIIKFNSWLPTRSLFPYWTVTCSACQGEYSYLDKGSMWVYYKPGFWVPEWLPLLYQAKLYYGSILLTPCQDTEYLANLWSSSNRVHGLLGSPSLISIPNTVMMSYLLLRKIPTHRL